MPHLFTSGRQRLLLLLLIAALGSLSPLTAATPWLKKPLQFVSADSVMTWSYSGTDFRQYVSSRDSTVKTPFFGITSEMWQRRDEIAALCREVSLHLNVVGGGDDERTVPQGLPARVVLSANAYMLLLTGQASHADIIERCLMNATVQTAGCTRLPFRQRDRRASFESLLSLPGLMYAYDESDLYVNLYTNSTARLQMADHRFTLDQITDMPADGAVKIRISRLRHPMRLRLHLRMPDWVRGSMASPLPFAYDLQQARLPRIFVCGHELSDVQPDENGYVVIDREWQSLDEVYFTLPLTPTCIRRTDRNGVGQRGSVALQVGPLVYAVPTPSFPYYFSTQSPLTLANELSSEGLPVVKGVLYNTSAAQADAPAPAVPFLATPFCEQHDSVGTVWCTECK